MRTFVLSSLLASATVMFTVANAQATDVLSQEDVARVLTLTSKTETKTIEVPAKGEARNLCDGCIITMEDGQSVDAKPNNIVFLMDGKISIYEP